MSQQGDRALLCTKAVCEAHHGALKSSIRFDFS